MIFPSTWSHIPEKKKKVYTNLYITRARTHTRARLCAPPVSGPGAIWICPRCRTVCPPGTFETHLRQHGLTRESVLRELWPEQVTRMDEATSADAEPEGCP